MSLKPNSAEQHDATGTPASRRSRSTAWASYVACGWAFAFAVVSFYWAAGGTIGLDTLAVAIERLALTSDPATVAAGWITGGLELLAGVLALALVRPSGHKLPRWMLLVAAWGTGVVLVLYG